MAKSRALVNFSFKKEVFFVVIGSIAGAFTMHLPRVLSDVATDSSYLFTLQVLASIVNSQDPLVGFLLHVFVATVIGIVTGILLYKALKFNPSKIHSGIMFGLIAGVIVFAVFSIPVSYFLIGPNAAMLSDSGQVPATVSWSDFAQNMANSLLLHIVWGITLGLVSSALTRKMGANYLCRICDVEFSKIATWDHHQENVHENPSPLLKKVLIVGGGYAGIGVLGKIQKRFADDVNVSITLVSESNFFLHTPMLPEMATGTVEPRHIATPIRVFCKRARFYQARVVSIDLDSKNAAIQRIGDSKQSVIPYDYLVLASGTKTNFFGNANVEKNSLTIKSLDDAIKIRNHVINALENADQEDDEGVRNSLTTFVIVGGGFSGVETAGEINEFVRDSVLKYYRNISPDSVRVVLVASGGAILPEIGNLGSYAKSALEGAGVTIHTNTRLDDYAGNVAALNNGEKISCATLIWAGGNMVDDMISSLRTEHHKSGRLVVNGHLRLNDHDDVYALGDCAYCVDPRNGTAYPPTAQHAIRQAKTVAENLANKIAGIDLQSDFVYDTKGSMAKIGKRDGVALLMGRELRGFAAWFVWKQYYLSTLPTTEKKIRVGLDWFIDLFFSRDITQLSNVFDDADSHT